MMIAHIVNWHEQLSILQKLVKVPKLNCILYPVHLLLRLHKNEDDFYVIISDLMIFSSLLLKNLSYLINNMS